MDIMIDEALVVINEELLGQQPGVYGMERKDHYPKTRENEVLTSLSCLAKELKKAGISPFEDPGYLYLLRLAETKYNVEFCCGTMQLPKEV